MSFGSKRVALRRDTYEYENKMVRPPLSSSVDIPAKVIQNGVLLLTGFVVLGPLIPLVHQAFLNRPIYDAAAQFTLSNFARLLGDPSFHQAALNTVYFSVVGTIVAQIIAVVSVILLSRTDVPGRSFFGGVLLTPIFLSHLILAIGFYTIYGPTGYVTLWTQQIVGVVPWSLYSVLGMAIVAGAAQAPLAYLFCLASTKTTDPTLEDAALMAGASPFRVLFNVTLPLMRPAILYGLSINLVVCMEMLSIPLIFGQSSRIDTFSVYIYKHILRTSVPDYGIVGVAAICLFLVVMLLLGTQSLLARNSERFVTVGGKSSRPRRFRLGWLRWPAFLVLAFYALISVVLPIGGLIVRSFTEIFTPLLPLSEVLTVANYQNAFSSPVVQRSIANTLWVAIATSTICTALVFGICVVAYRSQYIGAKALRTVAQVPRAIPGVFAGVALLYLVLALPIFGSIRNTAAVLVFAYLTRFIPIGIGAVQPALQQISGDLDKSSRVMGASWWYSNMTILLPLLKPALYACFAIVFIHSLKEYVTAVFLVAPGSEVIGPTMLSYWEEGQLGIVASLSTILIVMTALFLLISRKIFGVKLYD